MSILPNKKNKQYNDYIEILFFLCVRKKTHRIKKWGRVPHFSFIYRNTSVAFFTYSIYFDAHTATLE